MGRLPQHRKNIILNLERDYTIPCTSEYGGIEAGGKYYDITVNNNANMSFIVVTTKNVRQS